MHKLQQTSERNEYISSLQEFLSSSKELIHNSLQDLNWTEEATIFKNHEKILSCCPLNPIHRLPSTSIDKHLTKCRWHQQGYTDDCVPLPSPSKCSEVSLVIDKVLQANIILEAVSKNPMLKIDGYCVRPSGDNVREREVPQTADRIFSDFTTDERRVLYDYVVSKTAGMLPEIKEFSLPVELEARSGTMTKEQLMALERDAKRRRVRYRTAKVHTKSKNYCEVMREVINNQMLAYEAWLRDQHGAPDPVPSTESEMKSTEEAAGEKQEMIWLKWDYHSNPHLFWKFILEREKKRARRKENEKDEDKNQKEYAHDRRKDGEDDRGRERFQRDKSHKDDRRKDCEDDRERFQRDKSYKDHDRRRDNEDDRGRERFQRAESHRDHNRRKNVEDDRSRVRFQRDEFHRDSYNDSNRKTKTFEYEGRHRESKGNDSQKEQYRSDRERSDRQTDETWKTEMLGYSYLRNEKDMFRDYNKRERTIDYDDKSGYKDSDREVSEKSYHNLSSSRKQDSYYRERESYVRIKKEKTDSPHSSDSGDEYHVSKYRKLYHENVKIKQENDKESSDSNDKESHVSSFSHAKKAKKGKHKKSKKKHKHKHKHKRKHEKEKSCERSNRNESSTELSDE